MILKKILEKFKKMKDFICKIQNTGRVLKNSLFMF